jgi:phosphoribosylformimino-5-aminoimidazole carboxamide ribotide isomerase
MPSTPFYILPALDLLDGKSVRLLQGKRESAHEVHGNPLAQLKEYEQWGSKWVHMVDLNAAFGDDSNSEGRQRNQEFIIQALKETRLKVELGGGIRSLADAEFWLEKGVTRVVVGTWAVHSPSSVCELAKRYPGRIVVGLDTTGGKVTTQGWTSQSPFSAEEFGLMLRNGGVQLALFTEVERDGLLSGIDSKKAQALGEATGLRILASGGVRDIADIQNLSKCPAVEGVVVGKALAAKTLSLQDALTFQRS